MNPYSECTLCPRRCGVNRLAGASGFCGETADLRLACASIHRGEEPPLTGGENGGGSGTIFVSGCNLGCGFCQNYQISAAGTALGNSVDLGNGADFVRICLVLQEKGAENINIVTGSHAVPALAEGIRGAKAQGLRIPVLWNSSAYELPQTLELLHGLVDVFLPDLKTLDAGLASRYFHAPDYPETAAAAIKKMIALAVPGALPSVIVRHLVLPDHTASSREALRWFARHRAAGVQLSLMFQYTPPAGWTRGNMPDRFINREEYDRVISWLDEFAIEDGYCQELIPGTTDWLPDFTRKNPFPSELSVPVWHWREGWLL